MTVVYRPARAFRSSPPSQNLMVGVGDHLRICDFGLAGECDKEKIDPWTGKEHMEYGNSGPPVLICAPFTGGTPTYMSEEVGGLRRELAAATTVEEYRRIKEAKKVTAATTDLVAAALVALELYAQTNRWKLIMLTVKDAAGIDGRDAREMLRKLGARRSLAEVAAWSGEDLAAWLARDKMLARFQPMALEGSITIGALLDGVVAGDVTSLLSAAPPDVKVTVGVKGKLRNTVREQLSMLVMSPPMLEMLEAILHEEVGERPRDARAMMGPRYRRTEFGKWCDSVSGIEEVRARGRGSDARPTWRDQSLARRLRRSTRKTKCATRWGRSRRSCRRRATSRPPRKCFASGSAYRRRRTGARRSASCSRRARSASRARLTSARTRRATGSEITNSTATRSTASLRSRPKSIDGRQSSA